MPKIVFYSSTGEWIEFTLKEKNSIGRHPMQDLQILDRIVSKEHAEIYRGDTGLYYLQDVGSRNGTILNGERIEQAEPLKDGDEITLGSYILRFQDDGSAKRSAQSSVILRPRISGQRSAVELAPVEQHKTELPKTTPNAAVQHRMQLAQTRFLPESEIQDQEMLRRDYEKLRIAAEISNESFFVFEMDKLLRIIVDKAFQVFVADRCAILLRDDNGQMQVRVAIDRRGRQIRDIRLSQTILDEVMNEKTALLSSDAMLDQRFNASESIILDSIRSTMCVPLLYENEVLGIINLDTQLLTSAFTEKDLQILTGFARQAAFNLRHSQLMQEREKNIIARDNLRRIISPHLVDDVLNGKLQLKKSGSKHFATVLYSDIRGFTSMTERSLPEEIVAMLNEFFEVMVKIIFDYEGILDKFIGDEIMAVWGVSMTKEDHALRATRCAIDMMRALDKFNDERRLFAQAPIHIGIGIASGEMIAGYMGSTQAMSYTVIGDTVNLGARLCSAASAGEILLDENANAGLQGKVKTIALPPMTVKGKAAPIKVFRAIED
ncbi:MAG: adenylate/guanylate cyclase domain-containing protein [Bradymonadales bacterium]|jgi:adenylate cyclase